MANILAVDDDGDLRALIAETLGRDGHFVRTLDSGSRIGEAHCRRIRTMTDAPILFLTALNGEADVLEALGSGGDDYLTKPFRIAELRARVAAHLRRQRRPVSHRLVRGGVAFDLAAGTAAVEGRPVGLTRGEYALCRVLALHAGQTFGKERLYEEAFGFEREADPSAVTEHIKNIRAKFRAAGCEPVETVWGVGYRWKP